MATVGHFNGVAYDLSKPCPKCGQEARWVQGIWPVGGTPYLGHRGCGGELARVKDATVTAVTVTATPTKH